MQTNPSGLETAILIPAPPDVQRIAYPLAKTHAARMVELYPVHLTLLWPFVPFEQIDEGGARLAAQARTVAPVEVTFDGYGMLGRSVYMKPADPQPLIDLFGAVYQAFPDCQPYFGAFQGSIEPHLTVGLFKKATTHDLALFPPYDPFVWRIDRLHIFYGPAQERLPWIVHEVARLGA